MNMKKIVGGEKMRRLRKGQSTLEYVIILAAVVGAIIAVAAALGPKISGGYGKLGDTMQSKVDTVKF
jgi:Flp pilus assembly pilin Flp